MKHVRNFGIVALLALGVAVLPGGGTAADLFGALLLVVLTIGIGLVGGRLWLERRTDIDAQGDGWRLLMYAAVGVIVLTLAAGPRLFDTGAGTVGWIALIVASIYALYRVFRHAREY